MDHWWQSSDTWSLCPLDLLRTLLNQPVCVCVCVCVWLCVCVCVCVCLWYLETLEWWWARMVVCCNAEGIVKEDYWIGTMVGFGGICTISVRPSVCLSVGVTVRRDYVYLRRQNWSIGYCFTYSECLDWPIIQTDKKTDGRTDGRTDGQTDGRFLFTLGFCWQRNGEYLVNICGLYICDMLPPPYTHTHTQTHRHAVHLSLALLTCCVCCCISGAAICASVCRQWVCTGSVWATMFSRYYSL